VKILVGVKRVLDYNVKARVKADGSGIELANVKMSMNPFDEIAVEEALRIKEAGHADEVIVMSIGTSQNQETIRTGLAMGADRGILIQTDEQLQPLAIAKLLKHVIDEESPGLVILGKQAIDGDNNQTGQMLSALTGMTQATFASKIEFETPGEEGAQALKVTREVDAGLESIRVTLPCIVTTDLRLNEPRYTKLPNIVKAKKKPLEIIALADTGVDVASGLSVVKVSEPPKREAGIMVSSVAELVGKLRDEAKVI